MNTSPSPQRHYVVLASPQDAASIHRLAPRIYSRHINEGYPITWQQAKADAVRAWHEVKQLADQRPGEMS